MEVNQDNVCRLCKKIFCCVPCRRKHVLEAHSAESHPDCPLCNNSNLVLRFSTIEPFLSHIAQHHLPLGCVKCGQVVESEADLRKLDHTCVLVKVNAQPDIVVTTTPTDPPKKMHAQANTPTTTSTTSKFNQLLAAAAGAGSTSLVRSASTAYMSTTTCAQVTTRLIRSTSTPTTQEVTCVLKTNQFLNGSVSQMSSICNQSSVLATSPHGLGITPGAPKVEKFKMPMHQKNRKGSNVQTPLRQVMSMNVQRALLNHDFLSQSHSQSQSICQSPGQPLDLRTKKSFVAEPEQDAVEEIIEEEQIISSLAIPVVPDLLTTPTKNGGLSGSNDSPDDCVFYTPNPASPKYRRRRRSSIFVQVEEYDCDDASSDRHIEMISSAAASFDHDLEDVGPEPKISLWNVLSNVLRFASNRIMHKTEPEPHEVPAILSRDTSLEDDSVSFSSMKRPLTSPQQQHQSPRNPAKRIRGRRPIARMRELAEKE